ncbi:unnamed protein product [Durusdinium trenchii]|uniref:XIAP-associated factor 1 n=1 Tax=Durusdinium trenchii TaxID=1381693 RepID=A0ABP0NKC4_9DINO
MWLSVGQRPVITLGQVSIFPGRSLPAQDPGKARQVGLDCHVMAEAIAGRIICSVCHRSIRPAIFAQHQARCSTLCQARDSRERHACQEQALIDSLGQQRAAAFSCRRLSWSEVRSPRTSCRGNTETSSTGAKSASSRSAAKTATPLASPRETSSGVATPATDVPITPRPCTQRCSHCGAPVLRSSVAQHEARCQQRAQALQAQAGYPNKCLSLQKSPQKSCDHQPSPTEPCPSCGRLIACHGLQAHYQRCKKWTEILEEKRRPTLLESHRGKEASKKSEEPLEAPLGEAPLQSKTCFVPAPPISSLSCGKVVPA